ncbi:MAG: hypothetical protein WC717_06175, partial [Candidatus Micrarchaeia archaeon]
MKKIVVKPVTIEKPFHILDEQAIKHIQNAIANKRPRSDDIGIKSVVTSIKSARGNKTEAIVHIVEAIEKLVTLENQ